RLKGRGATTLNTALMGGAALIQTATGQLIGAFPDRTGESAAIAYGLLFASLAGLTAAALLIYRRAADIKPDVKTPTGRRPRESGRHHAGQHNAAVPASTPSK
ncbi:MAG TPA: hypothetical protein VHG30_16985, partial [Microvirga sp.]|nr:hypothetical protein [Microvirga sp.]